MFRPTIFVIFGDHRAVIEVVLTIKRVVAHEDLVPPFATPPRMCNESPVSRSIPPFTAVMRAIPSSSSLSVGRGSRGFGEVDGVLQNEHKHGVHTLAYSDEHDLLFSAAFDFDAAGWDVGTGYVQMRLIGHRAALLGVVIVQHDTQRALTVDYEGVFKLWEIRRHLGSRGLCIQSFSAQQGLTVVQVARPSSESESESLSSESESSESESDLSPLAPATKFVIFLSSRRLGRTTKRHNQT